MKEREPESLTELPKGFEYSPMGQKLMAVRAEQARLMLLKKTSKNSKLRRYIEEFLNE